MHKHFMKYFYCDIGMEVNGMDSKITHLYNIQMQYNSFIVPYS